jgi:hypothetical protein
MFKLWHYVFKHMRHNPVRTLLTVFGTGLAAFIVIYLAAVFDSRNQLVTSRSETMLVVSQKDVYCPGEMNLPGDEDMARRIMGEVDYVIGAAPVRFKQNA